MGIIKKIQKCISNSCSDSKMQIDESKILEKRLSELEHLNENEKRRREMLLNKGNSIISVISIISGVVIALSIFIQKEADVTKDWLIVFAAITVAIGISILCAMLFVFKLTARENRMLLGPKDLIEQEDERYVDYLKTLIKKNELIFENNKDVINRKVDLMVNANRAVLVTGILFTIYTIILLIWVCVR